MVQVLLVEPCDMVRQVNQLALRAWGTSVCGVKTQDEAISRLKLRGEFHLACLAVACSAVCWTVVWACCWGPKLDGVRAKGMRSLHLDKL